MFDGEVVVAESQRPGSRLWSNANNELNWPYVNQHIIFKVRRKLLRHAIVACGGNLTDEVLIGNEPALALYLSEGFKILHRIDGKLTGNESFAASGYVLELNACKV